MFFNCYCCKRVGYRVIKYSCLNFLRRNRNYLRSTSKTEFHQYALEYLANVKSILQLRGESTLAKDNSAQNCIKERKCNDCKTYSKQVVNDSFLPFEYVNT